MKSCRRLMFVDYNHAVRWNGVLHNVSGCGPVDVVYLPRNWQPPVGTGTLTLYMSECLQ